jgi:hypothetical protein
MVPYVVDQHDSVCHDHFANTIVKRGVRVPAGVVDAAIHRCPGFL